MPPYSLLCTGREALLLDTRVRVLARDFVVEAAGSVDAVEHARSGSFDLVVICHTFSPEERLGIVSFVRQTWPGAKILALTKKTTGQQPVGVDDVLETSAGPGALLEAAHKLLEHVPPARPS